jgi:DNA-binding Xre family transcriptional regulator
LPPNVSKAYTKVNMPRKKKSASAVDLPEISVEIARNGQLDERFGPDLNEAAREALRAHAAATGLSNAELSAATGVRSQTMNMFLKGEQGMRVDMLSRVCAALQLGPGPFFESGGAYPGQETTDEAVAVTKAIQRAVPKQFRADLLEMVLLADALGITGSALESALLLVRAVAENQGVDADAVKERAWTLAKDL